MIIFRKPVYRLPLLVIVLFVQYTWALPAKKPAIKLPYKQAGLSKQQAAAHLLSRFSFGATPVQVAAVADAGLENWLFTQLYESPVDAVLDQRLSELKFLQYTDAEMVAAFPNGGQIRRRMIAEGLLPKPPDTLPQRDERKAIADYMKQHNLYPKGQLMRQLIEQKILRAVYHPHQLQEVLVHFWYNHFNVSVEKDQAGLFVPSFESKIIRPNALGKFEELLLATAHSPAMLQYLDNSRSSVNMADAENDQMNAQQRRLRAMAAMPGADTMMNPGQLSVRQQGLNENYARELMELHTLGVDGGYTQQDVTQAAKVLTGWTLYPMGYGNDNLRGQLEKLDPERLAKRGFVVKGSFLFAGNRHDRTSKTVLGQSFAAGGGYEEGLRLINLLANHPSTAKFICTKLAIRFVSDQPPAKLIEEMAATFKKTGGDIREVLLTMVSSQAFWKKDALREKTKSPFELAISTLRATDATVVQAYPIYNWITRMGEKLYAYQAPTGFPDRATYWINTGSLLNRMNFGLAFSAGKIPGVQYKLNGLLQNREPESADAALLTFFELLMPERDATETMARLTPLIREPDFNKKIEAALQKVPNANSRVTANENMMEMEPQQEQDDMMAMNMPRRRKQAINKNMNNIIPSSANNNPALAQVLGVLLGSPEFQRR